MIFYFSATGNSKYVAKRIAEATKDQTEDILNYLNEDKKHYTAKQGENIIIVSPCYAFGIPDLVGQFLMRVKMQGSRNYFAYVTTYGSIPGNSGVIANDFLKHYQGIKFDALYSVKMPDTWTPVFDLSNAAKVAKTNEKAEQYIDKAIENIRKRNKGNFMQHKIPKFTKIFYKSAYDHLRHTKNFTVDDTCISCGLCQKKCPVSAIELQNGKPVWIKDTCTMCLGCLHRCPKFSIQYGKNTRKHGQYRNPNG